MKERPAAVAESVTTMIVTKIARIESARIAAAAIPASPGIATEFR